MLVPSQHGNEALDRSLTLAARTASIGGHRVRDLHEVDYRNTISESEHVNLVGSRHPQDELLGEPGESVPELLDASMRATFTGTLVPQRTLCDLQR